MRTNKKEFKQSQIISTGDSYLPLILPFQKSLKQEHSTAKQKNFSLSSSVRSELAEKTEVTQAPEIRTVFTRANVLHNMKFTLGLINFQQTHRKIRERALFVVHMNSTNWYICKFGSKPLFLTPI